MLRILSAACALVLVVACGKAVDGAKDDEGPLTATPPADADATFYQDGVTYSSLGICTPVWTTRKSKSDHYAAYADHALEISFTLKSPESIKSTAYVDAECSEKIGDGTTGTLPVPAGSTSVAAFIKAEQDGEPSGKFAGSVTFAFDKNDGASLHFSPESSAVDGLGVEILNVGKGDAVLPGACTRFPLVLSNDAQKSNSDGAVIDEIPWPRPT